MSKDLRKELSEKAKAFQYEPEETKKRARELYKVALKALDRVDLLRKELDAYKAPPLIDKSLPPDHEAKKEKRFLTPLERLKWFYENDPNGPGMKRILETMNITLSDAQEIVRQFATDIVNPK
jgi:hypothetical protein